MKADQKITIIGSGIAARQLREYYKSPVVIVSPPKLTEDERKKMIDQLNGCSGRAMLTIEQPEIEFIPFVSPKHARFIKYAMPNKKQYQVRTKKM